ncbi:NB-ARC domain-containing protein [Nocardia salmonicida]|uniref:NB-ARC domain-containing protein n=1 Tax=Nocardia salmonicida TaxID=53431 RepID=UPI0033D7E596
MVSISSKTAYVVIACIEDEFRSILEEFCGDLDAAATLGPELFNRAIERRVRDKLSNTPTRMAQMLPYLDFQDSYDLLRKAKNLLPGELAEPLRTLAPRVQRIAATRNRVAHNRPLEIDDLPTVVDLAKDLSVVAGWDWPLLNTSLNEIQNDPGYVFRSSARLITDPGSTIAHNLPTPDFDETSFLGRRDERRNINRALRGAWPVISVLGDGGIGKTALALQVCYDLLEQECPFEAIVWVSAKNSQLTSTEIVRIENAVEDSLGLFASAAAEFGELTNSDNAIDALIGVLETFPTLLVLDNVETVLDESFPKFLREIPMGSKVLITSRIGVKTENPFHLSGLSDHDALRLMRALARARGFNLPAVADEATLADWARRMNYHPAYIKWFMSGLQVGQTPQQLLNDNGLVLDFCMSNVYEFLTATAKSALRAMYAVPGAHTMAELAFLTELDSSKIQKVVLDLTRTNFVSQVRSGTSGTALELSDFARAYLRRTLTLTAAERENLADKQRRLYAEGGGLQTAHAQAPYDKETIDVRGVGDYSAAKLLRDALEMSRMGNLDEALHLCLEASELAPGYHEASRIEAHLHEQAANFNEAYEAHSRAKDLAPENSYIAYFFGNFLVTTGFDPIAGIRELQRAAKIDSTASEVHLAIALAHELAEDFRSAMEASAYAIKSAKATVDKASVFNLWKVCSLDVRSLRELSNWAEVAESLETALDPCVNLSEVYFDTGTTDIMLHLVKQARDGASECVDNYIARRLFDLATSIGDLRARLGIGAARSLGTIYNLRSDRGFGFVNSGGSQYFFHVRELWDRALFEDLSVGCILAFEMGTNPFNRKAEATSINWVA